MNVLIFLINTILGLYLYTLVARIWMQKCRVNYFNPLSQFVVRVTDPLVKPCRRFIPGVKGFDLSILFCVTVIQTAVLCGVLLLMGVRGVAFMAIVSFVVAKVISLIEGFFFYVIIVSVLLSWLQPRGGTPLAEIATALSEPLLRLARRFVPQIGGLDFSPLILIVVLQLIKMVLVSPLLSFSISNGLPPALWYLL